MIQNLFTIHDVARIVGVPFYRIAYAHDAGLLPEPPRFGGRRVYDHDMIDSVRQYFERQVDKEVSDESDER